MEISYQESLSLLEAIAGLWSRTVVRIGGAEAIASASRQELLSAASLDQEMQRFAGLCEGRDEVVFGRESTRNSCCGRRTGATRRPGIPVAGREAVAT